MTAQLPLIGACPRCGAPMLSLHDLAEAARAADVALANRKLVLPDAVPVNVRLLASCLPCRAGTCRERTCEASGDQAR